LNRGATNEGVTLIREEEADGEVRQESVDKGPAGDEGTETGHAPERPFGQARHEP
jgi:hypothetical protein